MLVDLNGVSLSSQPEAPSMERGAALFAELMLADPETVGATFMRLPYAKRAEMLADLEELMLFLRQVFGGLHGYHLAHPAEDPLGDNDQPR